MAEREAWRNVGLRVREVRKTQQLTLKQLAVGCGLSTNAISLVERGEVAPTILTLCKIANALGVSPSTFFQEICSSEVVIHRAEEGHCLQTSEQALNMLTSRTASHLGSSGGAPVCGLSGKVPRQTVLCVSGQISYEVDGESYCLKPGDSLTFNGEAVHRWVNSGCDTGVAILVLPTNVELNRMR